MAGDAQKILEAGKPDHVTTPIDPERLFAAPPQRSLSKQ